VTKGKKNDNKKIQNEAYSNEIKVDQLDLALAKLGRGFCHQGHPPGTAT
jgi:hypothetical protein